MSFQSTLPIQGETFCFLLPSSETVISIHSPYTGRDGTSAYTAICLSVISIHSPYTGRDCSCCMCVRLCGHFNPLSLYRERRYAYSYMLEKEVFQSTLPIQGETAFNAFRLAGRIFQSTLPIQGETDYMGHSSMRYREFQSTLPIQGETCGITGE